MVQNAVLQIWYDHKPHKQGKFFFVSRKPYYLANIDDAKLFRKFNGYAISKRLLEAFYRVGMKNITIIYRRTQWKTCYTARIGDFNTHGIPVDFGGHRQVVLPLEHWHVIQLDFSMDPKDLPVMDLEKWANMPPEFEYTKDGTAYRKQQPAQPVQEALFV